MDADKESSSEDDDTSLDPSYSPKLSDSDEEKSMDSENSRTISELDESASEIGVTQMEVVSSTKKSTASSYGHSEKSKTGVKISTVSPKSNNRFSEAFRIISEKHNFFFCTKCNTSIFFQKKSLFLAQLLSDHNDRHKRRYTCVSCEKCFRSHCILVKHMKAHTRPISIINLSSHSKKETHANAMKTGSSKACHGSDKNSFKSKKYQKQFPLSNSSKSNSTEGNSECRLCGKLFFTILDLINHELSVHSVKVYLCNICWRTFYSQDQLKHHTMVVHSLDNTVMIEDQWCSLCSRNFPSDDFLSKHKLLHASEKRYLCRECEIPFFSVGSLIQHTLDCHASSVYKGTKVSKKANCKVKQIRDFSAKQTTDKRTDTSDEETTDSSGDEWKPNFTEEDKRVFNKYKQFLAKQRSNSASKQGHNVEKPNQTDHIDPPTNVNKKICIDLKTGVFGHSLNDNILTRIRDSSAKQTTDKRTHTSVEETTGSSGDEWKPNFNEERKKVHNKYKQFLTNQRTNSASKQGHDVKKPSQIDHIGSLTNVNQKRCNDLEMGISEHSLNDYILIRRQTATVARKEQLGVVDPPHTATFAIVIKKKCDDLETGIFEHSLNDNIFTRRQKAGVAMKKQLGGVDPSHTDPPANVNKKKCIDLETGVFGHSLNDNVLTRRQKAAITRKEQLGVIDPPLDNCKKPVSNVEFNKTGCNNSEIDLHGNVSPVEIGNCSEDNTSTRSKVNNRILCEQCSFTFKNEKTYRTHCNKYHMVDTPSDSLICSNTEDDICRQSSSFKTESSYKQHLSRCHAVTSEKTKRLQESDFPVEIPTDCNMFSKILPTIKECICWQCNITFETESSFKLHLKKVHTFTSKCDCGVKFLDEYLMREYFGLHIVNDKVPELSQHPFWCEDCNITFTCKGYFDSHNVIHASSKRYWCRGCDVPFTSSSALVQHVLDYHVNSNVLIHEQSNSDENKKINIEPNLTCKIEDTDHFNSDEMINLVPNLTSKIEDADNLGNIAFDDIESVETKFSTTECDFSKNAHLADNFNMFIQTSELVEISNDNKVNLCEDFHGTSCLCCPREKQPQTNDEALSNQLDDNLSCGSIFPIKEEIITVEEIGNMNVKNSREPLDNFNDDIHIQVGKLNDDEIDLVDTELPIHPQNIKMEPILEEL